MVNTELKSIKIILTSILFYASVNLAIADSSRDNLITSYEQTKMTPTQVLEELSAGNKRYTNGTTEDYNQRQIAKLASQKGQAPYAFIFSCVDSRSIPEVIFDQPAGSLFTSRIAGNVIGPDVLGSMEFATQYAGTKLIVLMGHTQCGAVAGSCAGVNTPKNLHSLLEKIQPAVNDIDSLNKNDLDCNNNQDINEIAKENVIMQIQELYKQSPVTKKLVNEEAIKVVGAMHDIGTGKVIFFEEK